MEDQYLNMLQFAAAVAAPLRLEISRDGAKQEVAEFAKPFLVIGRHPKCDIVIQERQASSRHLYLQPIGQRLAAIDLFSKAGTEWNGAEFHGWLSDKHTIKIPGAEIKLKDSFWASDGDLPPPMDFKSRDEHRDEYGLLPKVELELTNSKKKGAKWPINRVVTLIGRDERCRITVLDKNISRIHCSFLLLPSGLWVIDLHGRVGVKVNGEKTVCSLLAEGSQLQLGPYELTAHYPEVAQAQADAAAVLAAPQGGMKGEKDFLTQRNKIFQTEIFGETLVIFPVGDAQSFFYQDIHIEASRVQELIKRRNFKNVIIDFSRSTTIGHMLIESLSAFCRSATGKAALCACNVATYEMLQTTKLPNIWPHYRTREDALQAVSM